MNIENKAISRFDYTPAAWRKLGYLDGLSDLDHRVLGYIPGSGTKIANDSAFAYDVLWALKEINYLMHSSKTLTEALTRYQRNWPERTDVIACILDAGFDAQLNQRYKHFNRFRRDVDRVVDCDNYLGEYYFGYSR
jgi:hypothetical protein